MAGDPREAAPRKEIEETNPLVETARGGIHARRVQIHFVEFCRENFALQSGQRTLQNNDGSARNLTTMKGKYSAGETRATEARLQTVMQPLQRTGNCQKAVDL